ncbi:heparin lyase I family protein [Bradyrhizobium sp. Ec3.3]|uniref:heparin lyase I family protein n=1 Tax=Bradyrhizobium sp. Ec3.3 TaxID=189753 RepID=UPI000405575B|nr:heparin lyase I family protein [Bradyrhizobium sp. Ec3.3]
MQRRDFIRLVGAATAWPLNQIVEYRNLLIDYVAPPTAITTVRTASSQNTVFNTAAGGTTASSHLNVFGTANAGVTFSIYVDGALSGTTTSDASGNWVYDMGVLADGSHAVYAANGSGVSPTFNFTIAPNITNFDATANVHWTGVDGEDVQPQHDPTAGKTWCVTNPDTHTLRYEVRASDYWSTTGWSDLTNDAGANRSEFEFAPRYSDGTQIYVTYELTVLTGPIVDSSFCDLGHLDSTAGSAPSPVQIVLQQNTDKMQITLQSPSNNFILAYQDANPITRGRTYKLDLQMKMDSVGTNGLVRVWRDGVQIVNYSGQVGSPGATYYWKSGIYRSSSPAGQTQAATIRNVLIASA